MDAAYKAIVTGVTGVVGRHLALHLRGRGGWEVVGLSRRTPDIEAAAGGFEHIPIDLLDASECRRKLGGLSGVTHIFHAAYVERPSMAEALAPNLALLSNVVEVIEPLCAETLRRIRLTEMMADKAAVWDRMVKKHRLKPYRYEEIVSWAYGDFVFTPEFDIMSDMTKIRQHGFCDAVDTEKMLYRLFDQFRRGRVIP